MVTSSTSVHNLIFREARSDQDYYRAYPVIRQLLPELDMQLYTTRAFVARAAGYRMFLAQFEGTVVGVLGLVSNYNLHDGFSMFVEYVVVDQVHRNRGFGYELLSYAEARAREEGCKLLELDVDFDAEVAVRMYERAGFKRYGHCYEKILDRKG